MEEAEIIELFNKYKDLRTKKPIEEAMTLHSFKKAINEAIDFTYCSTRLNQDFKIGDDVWITSQILVKISDFAECGKRVQVEDGCEYYLVDIDEITKVV